MSSENEQIFFSETERAGSNSDLCALNPLDLEVGKTATFFLFQEDICYKYLSPFNLTVADQTLQVSNWRQVYKLSCQILAQIYPSLFTSSIQYPPDSFMGKLLNRNPSSMIYPEEIAPGVIIETHGSSDDLMNRLKKIARNCGIKPEQIFFACERVNPRGRKKGSSDQKEKQLELLKPQDPESKGREEFAQWLTNSDVSMNLTENYLNALDALDQNLQELGKQKRSLWLIRGISRLETILKEVEQSDCWKDTPGSNILFTPTALEYFISFRSGDLICPGSDKIPDQLTITIKELLENYFKNGFPINSKTSYLKLRNASSNETILQNFDDTDLQKYLEAVGSVRGDRIFPRLGKYDEDLLDDIEEELESLFENGATSISAESLFNKKREDLIQVLSIYSPEVLASTLINRSYGKFVADKEQRICRIGVTACCKAEVLNIIDQSSEPIDLDTIANKLWHLTRDEIKKTLKAMSKDDGVISLGGDLWLSTKFFPLDEDGAQRITEAIHQKLITTPTLSENELSDLVIKVVPELDSIEAIIEKNKFWNCLKKIFEKDFSFSGKTVSEKGTRLSPDQIITNFCIDHESFDLSELKSFTKDNGIGVVPWETIRSISDRVSSDQFIASELIKFEIPATDEIIDKLISHDYLPLKKITFLSSLPPVYINSEDRLPWNLFLFESYIYGHSKLFKLLHRNFAITDKEEDIAGAVVRNTSNLTIIDDLMANTLYRREDWDSSDKENALDILLGEGLISRRRFEPTRLEEIILKASQLRKNQKFKEHNSVQI